MIDISHALTIEGYMSETELTYLAETASKSSIVIEVGSWKGRSTCALAANCSGVVIAVDTWSGDLETNESFNPDMFHQFVKNVKPYKNIIPILSESLRASYFMNLLGLRPDMVFLDGDHKKDNVRQDILSWRSLLKKGGVLCGHDYGFSGWPDVKTVVDEMIPKFRTIETIWTTEGCS